MAARACGVAMEMTQQYLAGELSVLLERVQAVATTAAAGRRDWADPGAGLRDGAGAGPDRAVVLGLA